VAYDSDLDCLVADGRSQHRRKAVTPCRDALNGYQKGRCFYCFADISLVGGADDLADVDHFFPHRLKGFRVADPVDGVDAASSGRLEQVRLKNPRSQSEREEMGASSKAFLAQHHRATSSGALDRSGRFSPTAQTVRPESWP